jgi:hypothetical protein
VVQDGVGTPGRYPVGWLISQQPPAYYILDNCERRAMAELLRTMADVNTQSMQVWTELLALTGLLRQLSLSIAAAFLPVLPFTTHTGRSATQALLGTAPPLALCPVPSAPYSQRMTRPARRVACWKRWRRRRNERHYKKGGTRRRA